MTRYEFEVLSHLERNGAGQYSLRALSDALTISGGKFPGVWSSWRRNIGSPATGTPSPSRTPVWLRWSLTG